MQRKEINGVGMFRGRLSDLLSLKNPGKLLRNSGVSQNTPTKPFFSTALDREMLRTLAYEQTNKLPQMRFCKTPTVSLC